MATKSSSPPQDPHGYVVEPAKAWPPLSLGELWEYRNLIYFLAWRDIKLQFKQTALGATWAVLQPLCLALVFSVVFGMLFKSSTGDIPFLVFFYSGLVPWTLFTSCLTASANSVVGDANLVQKVYFPRLVFPIAAVIPPLFDFAFAFLVLIVMCLCYGILPGPGFFILPFFILLAVLTGFGVGLWFCAVNVRYRDARYLLPLTATMWLYLTPVFYSLSMIPDKLRPLFAMNPMVGVIEGTRWALFRSSDVPWPILGLSFLATLLVLIGGLFYFRRCEETFADEL